MLGIGAIARKVFGSANDRLVKRHLKAVEAINALEPEFEKLSDQELRAKTDEFRKRHTDGESLDALMPEAFAAVREAAKRTLGQRHFDVQMVGGIVLHQGEIAEMKTGEGKTLVATLAVYLNAIPCTGVHVVTVNDYLATRDAGWMGQIYEFLGLSVGVVVHGQNDEEKREAYASDVTYGTNNEFGFDYLRDNMKFSLEEMTQRPFNFAIVDEVDSILIDEARTPLIISGPTEDKSDLYIAVDRIIRQLGEDDYEMEEKNKSVTLSEEGTERIEGILQKAGLLNDQNLYDYGNTTIVHHVNQALKAQKMFESDKDYIVKDDKVVIIDEFTGRMMEGRRYSDGLHQALEAKEGVQIQSENQTLASITFQNYFRMYPKLAGMTGTAATESQEFADIYGLPVVDIPTNVEVNRADDEDVFYRTAEEKFRAIVLDIKDCQERGQPILVGTVSIEKSEHLSDILKKAKITHNVLNARYHEQEANIIGQAGQPGAVTIATNMAGRGTDIQLGGNLDMRVSHETADIEGDAKREKAIEKIKADIAEKKEQVIEAGGLYVMATERHESRRIDNQLRGRSGRQGDPGRSKFYLSLQDDLMRIFGPDRMDGMLLKLGIEEDEAIIHPWITKAIEKAQQKVEARNYDIRKNLLKFDNVMNDQRKVIYDQRIDIMSADEVSEIITDMRQETIEELVIAHVPPKSYPDQWDVKGLGVEVKRVFGMDLPLTDWSEEEGVEETALIERISDAVDAKMDDKAARYAEIWPMLEKSLLLQVVDKDWKDHLSILEHLRQVVGLRAYAQRDPLNEYKTEAFGMFETLLVRVREHIGEMLAHVEIRTEQAPEQLAPQQPEMIEQHTNPLTGENELAPPAAGSAPRGPAAMGGPVAGPGPISALATGDAIDPQNPQSWGKVPRNAPCPCNSGRKYKHCHGRI